MVRASFAGFTTALSALQVSQKRLDITGQNLANMHTEGYTRQQLDVVSINSTSPSSAYISRNTAFTGFGVGITGVSQLRDPLLDAQYRSQMTKSGYTDAYQNSLDSLSNILDESQIQGLRQALANIRSTLTDMQDPAKALDSAYEVELRNDMESFTNLLNDAAREIKKAEQTEYERLDGETTNRNGAVQTVNDMLLQIATLNRQIKGNEVVGQNSNELKDTRNLLLDKLASYLPIEVTYFKDFSHDGLDADVNALDNELYDISSAGNLLAKKDWPEDVRVDLVYKDENGVTQRLTLVNGSEGTVAENYGNLSITRPDDDVHQTAITITGSATGPDGKPQNPASITITAPANDGPELTGGSIQASLDMLGHDGVNTGFTRGYQYYMDQLDLLAKSFVDTINGINTTGANNGNMILLEGDKASNVGITKEWSAGLVHITSPEDSKTGNILNMLEAMSSHYDSLNGNSFAGFISHVSTTLASDSYANLMNVKSNSIMQNGIQNARDSVSGVSMDEEAAGMMTYMAAYNAASRLMTTLDEALDKLINGTGTVGR